MPASLFASQRFSRAAGTPSATAFEKAVYAHYSQKVRVKRNDKLVGHAANVGIWPANAFTFSCEITTTSTDPLEWGVLRIDAGPEVGNARLTGYSYNRSNSVESGRGHMVRQFSPFANNPNSTEFPGPTPQIPCTLTFAIDVAPLEDNNFTVELDEPDKAFAVELSIKMAKRMEAALKMAAGRAAARVKKARKRRKGGIKSRLKRFGGRIWRGAKSIFSGVGSIGKAEMEDMLGGYEDQLVDDIVDEMGSTLDDYHQAIAEELSGTIGELMAFDDDSVGAVPVGEYPSLADLLHDEDD